jgi:hypothetical protein
MLPNADAFRFPKQKTKASPGRAMGWKINEVFWRIPSEEREMISALILEFPPYNLK